MVFIYDRNDISNNWEEMVLLYPKINQQTNNQTDKQIKKESSIPALFYQNK